MYTAKRDYNELIILMEKILDQSINSTVVLIDIDFFHDWNKDKTKNEKISNIYSFFTKLIKNKVVYLGKDEFAILCDGISIESILNELFSLKEKFSTEFQTTLSIGIAEYPKHGEDYMEIIRNLEESVYQAKNEGKNRISIVDVKKMKLKSNYYSPIQLSRLTDISSKLKRSEASLLREALDELIRKYE